MLDNLVVRIHSEKDADQLEQGIMQLMEIVSSAAKGLADSLFDEETG